MNIEDIQLAVHYQAMGNEEALAEIERLEHRIDVKLAIGEMTQERAWDCYFCLMHDCDVMGLMEDFRRLYSKIDTKAYKPFQSRHLSVRFLAGLRARMKGLIRHELN